MTHIFINMRFPLHDSWLLTVNSPNVTISVYIHVYYRLTGVMF